MSSLNSLSILTGFSVLIGACGGVNVGSQLPALAADPESVQEAVVPASCPVTQPGPGSFSPPAPWSPEPPYEAQVWFGTDELWTVLPADGTWRGLPLHHGVYTQKVFWWSKGYVWNEEPDLTLMARRPGANEPEVGVPKATNGWNTELQSFILTGVDLPGSGCWELQAVYAGNELSFVIWVEP